MAAPIVLAPQTRGDTFIYSTTLQGGWTSEQFTGGLRFTLRLRAPASTVLDDTDAVATASMVGGQIVAIGTSVEVTIPASVTKLWQAKTHVWDLQGIVTGVPNRVYTIARGTISIEADITRAS